ncbi:MAG: pcaR [Labilithrix sp.]|nr:pcaR [Labilithrix sp.]
MPREPEGPYVQSLERGLAVIRCFGEGRARLTISDVAREVGIDRAAARRFLHTLVELEYVGVEDGQFYLRPRVLELAQAYLGAVSPLNDVLQPHLDRLTSETEETSMACVLDGSEAVHIAGVRAKRLVAINVRVGTRVPAHASPLGHVLLAALPDAALASFFARAQMVPRTARTLTREADLRERLGAVSKQGYAIGDQELEVGLRTIAVPIRGREGAVVAAISIGVTASAFTVAQLRSDLLPRLQSTARRIETDLALIAPA